MSLILKEVLLNKHELQADILSLLQAAFYSYVKPMPCPTDKTLCINELLLADDFNSQKNPKLVLPFVKIHQNSSILTMLPFFDGNIIFPFTLQIGI